MQLGRGFGMPAKQDVMTATDRASQGRPIRPQTSRAKGVAAERKAAAQRLPTL